MIAAPASAGQELALPDLTVTFAQCTGRLSATMEHQWLMGEPATETQARRAAMIALLDSLPRTRPGREVLALRIAAKHAQSQLLTRATFNAVEEDASWARSRAEVEIARCAALVLM
jgi:hypothetical protein